MEHFDELRNDLQGFCEQLVPHRGKHRGAIFSLDAIHQRLALCLSERATFVDALAPRFRLDPVNAGNACDHVEGDRW